MNKKNLDTLFQEKFKDFREKPDERVWESIETSLDQKKNSRRVVPLWWKLGGIAAILAILFLIIDPFADHIPQQDGAITDTENNNDQNSNQEDGDKETLFSDPEKNKSDLVDTDNKENSDKGTEETIDQNPALAGVENESHKTLNNKVEKEKDFTIPQTNDSEKQGVAKTAHEGKPEQHDSDVPRPSVGHINMPPRNNDAVVQSQDSPNLENEIDAISVDSLGQSKNKSRSIITDNLNPSKEKEAVAQPQQTPEEIEQQSRKKSIFDEIKAQEEENQAIAEATGGRWSAGPSIAPVYYNAIGTGSPVHSIFVPNSKSGDINLSYGLSVAYEINDKLSVRSGIHRVDFGYDTNDVEFSSSLQASAQGQIDNIDYTLTSRSLVVQSKANEAPPPPSSPLNNLEALDFSAANPAREGTMAQQFGYIEVPVELNYALLDRKFGINLIGGVSSLFLVDNSVSLTSEGLTTEMGEANNINSVNFSTNVGFGLNYSFTSKLQLNVEPIFKYQLNTFSETAGNFQPFTVGVYSGLRFRF